MFFFDTATKVLILRIENTSISNEGYLAIEYNVLWNIIVLTYYVVVLCIMIYVMRLKGISTNFNLL